MSIVIGRVSEIHLRRRQSLQAGPLGKGRSNLEKLTAVRIVWIIGVSQTLLGDENGKGYYLSPSPSA